MPKGDREILKADPEDGTTPIAHLILDALSIALLSSKEIRAVIFILRRTFGWQKDGTRFKESRIPFEQWKEVLNMDAAHTSTLLTKLEEHNIIKRRYYGPRGSKDLRGYYYSINTHIGEWNNSCLNPQLLQEIASYEIPQQFPDREIVKLPKKETVTLPKTVTIPDTNLATSKENLNQFNLNNISRGNKNGKHKKGKHKKGDKTTRARKLGESLGKPLH